MPDLLPKTMLDRGAFWTPVPHWGRAVLEGEGWTARPVPGLQRILVSGNLEAALAVLAKGTPSLGLWEIAEAEVHALRIGRDRMLVTSEMPLPVETGWSTGGFAVSRADDAFATIEIQGSKLREVVAEMTFVDLDSGSPSAATLVCGQQALLHRTKADCARVHIEAPLATYLWHWLERR